MIGRIILATSTSTQGMTLIQVQYLAAPFTPAQVSFAAATFTYIDAFAFVFDFHLSNGHLVVSLRGRFHNRGPIDGIRKAEMIILMYDDISFHNMGQTLQSDLPQHVIIDDSQSGIIEQRRTPDQGQIREQLPDTPEPIHSVQQQVLGDFPQLGERKIDESFIRSFIQQHDLDISFDDGTSSQFLERRYIITDADRGTFLLNFAIAIR